MSGMSLQGSLPHPGEGDAPPPTREEEDARTEQWPCSPLDLYLQCSLSEAPGCFRTVLVRCLELAEGNFIPTNWRGFSDHFGLRELKARSAEELVDKWANKHPYRHEHTLRKVVEYARSKDHRKLLDSFVRTLRDHLLPEEDWAGDDPASCFKTCHCCVPLTRTNSRSSEDVHTTENSPSHHNYHPRRHRRTHSLPKDIEINHQGPPHPASPCCNQHTPGSSVTNIYMTCSCKNSPFTPSALTSPSGAWPPHTLISPTLTATTNTLSYTDTLARSPVQTVASATTTTTASPSHSCCGTPNPPRIPLHHNIMADSVGVSPLGLVVDEEGQGSGEDRLRTMSGRARRRHSSHSQDPTQPVRRQVTKQSHSSFTLGADSWSPLSSSQQHSPEATSSAEWVKTQVMEGLTEEKTEPDHVHDIAGDQEKKSEGEDVMYQFGQKLFDTTPYNLVQKFYNSSTREFIILLLATFFLYNGLRCILQTMCEDGGFHKVFKRSESTLDELTRRLAMLALRILTVVISPLCFCVHISPIASKPQIPRTNFSEEAAVERMMNVHRNFSPHYEVQFIQAQPKRVFQMSETMTKRHISSIWMSVLFVLLFAAILSYIGGVRLVARRFTEGGVCQFLTASIVHLPLLNDDIHLLMVLDHFLMLSVLLSIHMLKDYYYYENRIAVFAVTVGGEAEQLYKEIRRRWLLLDWYCYITAVAISVGTLALASVKKTIIPDPAIQLKPEDLSNWCFWISVLTVLCCLGHSSNRLVKKTSLPAFFLIAFLLKAINLNIDAIPPETLDVFFLIGSSVLVWCLLLSLSSCHYHHYQATESSRSLCHLLVSLLLMAILPVTVVGSLYRETLHLAAFVQW